MLRRSVLALLLGAVLLAASPLPASAEPTSPEKKAAAQALFDEARSLTSGGKFAEACPKFIESERLDATMGAKFYLADCLEHIGRIASAWTYYVEVSDAARAAGLTERARFAQKRAEALHPKLVRLSVIVSEPASRASGLEIKRDGLALSAALWGTPVPVDPGVHVVSASATGRALWEKRVDLTDPGQTVTVEIPALAEAPAPPDNPARFAQASPAPPEPKAPSPAPSGQRIAGFLVGAIGLAGIGVGAIFGVRAIGKRDDSNADDHCNAQSFCDDPGLSLRQEAITSATISTIGFIAGGVVLAGGGVLLLTAPSRGPSAPQLALGPGMLRVTGRW